MWRRESATRTRHAKPSPEAHEQDWRPTRPSQPMSSGAWMRRSAGAALRWLLRMISTGCFLATASFLLVILNAVLRRESTPVTKRTEPNPEAHEQDRQPIKPPQPMSAKARMRRSAGAALRWLPCVIATGGFFLVFLNVMLISLGEPLDDPIWPYPAA